MNKRGYTHLTRGKHRCGICQPFAYGLETNITSANFGKYLWGNSVLTKATEHAVMPWFSKMLLSHIVAKSHTETRRFSEMYASFGFSGAGPRQPADNTNVCLDGALGRYIDIFCDHSSGFKIALFASQWVARLVSWDAWCVSDLETASLLI